MSSERGDGRDRPPDPKGRSTGSTNGESGGGRMTAEDEDMLRFICKLGLVDHRFISHHQNNTTEDQN